MPWLVKAGQSSEEFPHLLGQKYVVFGSELVTEEGEWKRPLGQKCVLLCQPAAHLLPADLWVVPSEGQVAGNALFLPCQGIGLPIKPPTTKMEKQT